MSNHSNESISEWSKYDYYQMGRRKKQHNNIRMKIIVMEKKAIEWEIYGLYGSSYTGIVS